MKPNTSQFEILVFTNSSISKRQLAEKDSSVTNTSLSSTEELEKQCWAGFLSELLPEVISSFDPELNNYIWSIIAESNCINVNMGPYPQAVASQTSLDPHYFLTEFIMS